MIFDLAELIAVSVLDDRAATMIASLHEVNMCIVIICTVFATGMSLSVIPASPSAEYEHSSLVFDHFVHGSHF